MASCHTSEYSSSFSAKSLASVPQPRQSTSRSEKPGQVAPTKP